MKWGRAFVLWSPWARLFQARDAPGAISMHERASFVVFWLTIAAALTWTTGGWVNYLVLWMVPQLTFLNAFVRIRSVAEHLALNPADPEIMQSRHIDGTLLERLTICPLNINVHIAHHLFPSVPQYHLLALHRELLALKPYRDAKIFPSYFFGSGSAFSELLRKRPG